MAVPCASLLVLLLGVFLLHAAAYLPPLTTTGPNVRIGCDMTFSDYLDLVDTPGTVTYGGSNSSYQQDPLACPLKRNCRATDPAAPFTCFDGSCAASPRACNTAATFGCPPGQLDSDAATRTTCWDGSCGRAEPYAMRLTVPPVANGTYATLSTCPPLPPCRANEVRCWDLSCQSATGPATSDPCSAYTFNSLSADCASITSTSAGLLTAYQCCGRQGGVNNTFGLCGAYHGCTFDQVQCPDGTCVSLAAFREGACTDGCNTGEFRCYGKLKGNCTTDLTACPAPPSTSIFISEFVAGVSPTTENSTRLALRNSADGTELGWVAVPPISSTGVVHWNVFNYLTGAQLSDEDNSLCGSNWDTCDHAPLSIFSPVVGLLSYDLLLLYANTPVFSGEAVDVINEWVVEIALPVLLPDKIKPNKMCLAYTRAASSLDPGQVPVRGQAIWQCRDSNPVLDNSTTVYGYPVYKAYAPLDLMMRPEPFVHWAFVHDNSDDFGPVESIGGGFFAAGIALLVVGGTFLLANREKLVGRIYNDGGGTSTSAM